MRCNAHLLSFLVLLGLLVCPAPEPSHGVSPNEDLLVLVSTLAVGGQPSAIVVDHDGGRNDILFYDGDKVRFLDGDTLAVASEQLSLPTREWEGWMAHDRTHHHTYVLTTRTQETPMHVLWREAQVHIVAGRSILGSLSVNGAHNTDPLNPPDGVYYVDGLALKQPLSEGGNPARLIIDDIYNGNIDVIDLDSAGTTIARAQRHSYRAPVSGAAKRMRGNSLALEPKHETLATDDLSSSDLLYISDQNRWQGGSQYNGRIRTLRVNHPLQDLNATPLADMDLSGTWPFMIAVEGIALAGSRDVLYVASGLQDYDTGQIARASTTSGQLLSMIQPLYAEEGFVHVDWQDPKRAFAVTADGFRNDPTLGLYLYLFYDGIIVDSLRLMENYDDYDGVRGMDYDPLNGRLYITVASSIMVVQVSEGGAPPPGCPKPLTGVQIAGPIQGQPNTTYIFDAQLVPADASGPVTYTWSPQPASGQGTSSASYQWTTAGTHSISVEAENCGGKRSANHAITVDSGGDPTCPRYLTSVQIAGPGLGQPDKSYTFSAQLTPTDATPPLTYAWSPQPLSGQGTSVATYRWPTPGTHTISLEAENCGGKDSDVQNINLGDWEHVFLPLVAPGSR